MSAQDEPRQPAGSLNGSTALDRCSSPESNSDSSTGEDASPLICPRKRRRRMRPAIHMEDDSPFSSTSVASSRSSQNRRTKSSSHILASNSTKVDHDSPRSIETLEDVGHLVLKTHAPSVAAVYHQVESRAGSSCYEYIPLACFYPSLHGGRRKHTVNHFRLNMGSESKVSGWYFAVSRISDHPRFLDTGDSTPASPVTKAARSAESAPNKSCTQVQPPLKPCSSHRSDAHKDAGQVYKLCPPGIERIPVEVFELIAQHLSFTDVKSMRLVNKVFERGVSGHLFENVVVPFSIDIYGALATGPAQDYGPAFDRKGKGKATMSPSLSDELRQSNLAQQQQQYLDVFHGFGPHIRRFGISFEVSEQELCLALPKEVHQGQNAYWGDFRWPFPEYSRFQDRAGLEVTADETPTMKEALRHLNKVKHLALSIDSGLGWLAGPDLSMRSKFLKEPTHPFASFKRAPEPDLERRRALWELMQRAYEAAGNIAALKTAELVRYEKKQARQLVRPEHLQNSVKLDRSVVQGAVEDTVEESSQPWKRQENLEQLLQATEPRLPPSVISRISNLTRRPAVRPNLRGTDRTSSSGTHRTANHTSQWPLPEVRKDRGARSHTTHPSYDDEPATQVFTVPPPDQISGEPRSGILYTRTMRADQELGKTPSDKFQPNHLNQVQREWLMETSWAQDAFLSSYIVSVTDNSESLQSVTTLTLAPLSSSHLTKLFREDFWGSLPSLKCLELLVKPDWREIERHPAGYTSAPPILPAKALDSLYTLLDSTIASRKSIKYLTLGWTCGGEHAEGMHARNHLLMPAPLTDRASALATGEFGLPVLTLPHLEQLRLVNAWVAPNVLQDWTRRHLPHALKKLILESISLIAHPKNPLIVGGAAAANAAPGVQAVGGNLFTQMMQQLQQQLQQVQQNLPLAPAQVHNQLNQLVQNQLAQHIGVMQPVNGYNTAGGNANPGGLAALALAAQQPQPIHHTPPSSSRDGSWPAILLRTQNLVRLFNRELTICFESCGHAVLPRASFDQTAIEQAVARTAQGDGLPNRQTQAWFTQRKLKVREMLMQANDGMLAKIAVALPPEEQQMLENTWCLQAGWPGPGLLEDNYDDEDGWGKWGWRNKEGAEYDGEPTGGTGRFSGKVLLSAQDDGNDEQ